MATTAGNFTMTSAKFNTVAVNRGTYLGTLLKTIAYCDTSFLAVPSPRVLGKYFSYFYIKTHVVSAHWKR